MYNIRNIIIMLILPYISISVLSIGIVILMHHNIGIVCLTITISHIGPFLHSLGHEAHRTTTEPIGTPPIERHKVAALTVVRYHVCSLETPRRA